MTNHGSGRSPKVLRRIAALLIRSPDARFILDDLDELFERDVVRGLPRWRARLRYGRNALASALSTRGSSTRIPVLAGASWLDMKLGLRMVAKYPGLSLVSVLGMAVAIAIGAGVFSAIAAVRDPMLPLPGGNRIVAVQNNRADNPGNPDRQVLHDFVAWRSELATVRDLGAFRPTSHNLIIEGRGTDLVEIAEMSAAGFRVARVPPLLGRPLLEEDERAGAPPALVIGHDEWLRRFEGDPDIIGRTVRLGATVHAVVGVMPDGFHFPVSHGFWAPLRLDVTKHARGDGPSMEVFGRLADGVPLEQARAQLAAIGDRMAAAYPDTHEHLRPLKGDLMKSFATALGIAAIGVAIAVYGEADDAPGGVLFGMLLVVGAFALGVRTVLRRM